MVKSILVIIVISVFLEIVLPRNDMKRYINLIIGLFVIIAVLNPFLSVIHKEISFDVLNTGTDETNSDTGALIRKGRELANSQKTAAARQYKEKLARQISALAGLSQKSAVAGVEVDMNEDTSSADFGQVKKILIRFAGTGGKVGGTPEKSSGPAVGEIQVKEVQINSGTGKDAAPAGAKDVSATAGLKDLIANFYGLTPEQVEVQ